VKIIAFVGMPGAGKGEASKIARDLGVSVVNMGDVIRKEAKRVGVDMAEAGNLATELRVREGADVVARRSIPTIEELDTTLVLVDGIRSIDEVEAFKEAFGDNFTLVAIEASFKERLDRIKARKRADDPVDESGFLSRDERELGWGIGRAVKDADITIENNRSIKEFHERVKNLMDSFCSTERGTKLKLTVSALVYPTETKELVRGAIETLFPGLHFEETMEKRGLCRIAGHGDESNLMVFHRRLREERILTAVRAVFEKVHDDDFLEFMLNKQAATVGVISFPADTVREPLGTIKVMIEADELESVIDWLAPLTTDRRPAFEIEF